jgi:hypothetical protein
MIIAILRRKGLNKQENSGVIMVKIVLHISPLIAFYAALNILIFNLPMAVSECDYMKLHNICSSLIGLILGGTQSIFEIRKMNKKQENEKGNI